MSRKLRTKLLKLVCKRAELTRARFGNSSRVTNKNKKFVCINQTGDKFRSKVSQLSVGSKWSSIRKVGFIYKKKEFVILHMINTFNL